MERERLFAGKLIKVDRVRYRHRPWEVATMGEVAAILAVRRGDGLVLLVEQMRPAIGGQMLEIPAGRVEPGESPEDCARRELAEETGYMVTSLESLAVFYTSPGFTDELVHLYLARDPVLLESPPPGDQGEDTRPRWIPIDEARNSRDAKTLIAIQMLINEPGAGA